MQQTLERRHVTTEAQFEAFERERLRTDLVTEASERLSGAMENEFEYEHHEGELHFQGESLRDILVRGIQNTEEVVRTRPDFMVELLRRHIELRQYEQQLELLNNVDWQNPLVLVHISPTPDIVLSGEVDVNAYDLKRKKIMIRVSEPTVSGLKVTSFSLDGGDRVALQAVGDFFGVDIPDSASSEDILGMHFVAEKSQFKSERPAKVLRERYDDAMMLQYGGTWYAGRQDSKVLGTMQRIQRYPELVEEHVENVTRLKKRLRSGFRFTLEYEAETYNFLAAIEQAEKLGAVVGSLGDAGDLARAAGVEFAKSDCPSVQTATEALEQQGIGGHKWVNCPDCGYRQFIDPCASHLICQNNECRLEVKNGQRVASSGQSHRSGGTGSDISKNNTQHPKEPLNPSDYTKYSHSLERLRHIREVYGDTAEEVRVTGIGTEHRYVRDRKSGDFIDELAA